MGFYERWKAETERPVSPAGHAVVEVRTSALAGVQFAAIKVRSGVLKSDQEGMPDLPAGCPLLGGNVPNECRFESRFFRRMTREGALPLPARQLPLATCLSVSGGLTRLPLPGALKFGPVSAVFDLVNTRLDKFVRDKMSEKDQAELKQNMEMFIAKEARTESSAFRDIVVQYEGAAKDVPRLIVVFRSLIRPLFTFLVGWLDYRFFTGPPPPGARSHCHAQGHQRHRAAFWFGERALKNSGLIDILRKKDG